MNNFEQLKRLRAVKLTSEPDVEQEFVTPLLRILGYDHLRGEIERANSLSVPYHKSGTKRKEYIVPDYIIRAGGRNHFVLDAKKPGITEASSLSIVCDPEFVSQVYSYSAHREVAVPYFVITNGHYTAIYASDSLKFEPILLVSQKELSQQFVEIEKLISKTNVSRLLLKGRPMGWTTSVADSDVIGYQPMNFDIGDVNHDGIPEIAIAISENRIQVFDIAGNPMNELATGGWVWWVKCTHSQEANEAVLIALQHQTSSANIKSKVLGFGSDKLFWEYELERAGSGFETLDRILIYTEKNQAIIGAPADNKLVSLDFSGKPIWEKRVDLDSKFGSIMHLVKDSLKSDTFLATCNRERNGFLVRVSVDTGDILQKVELRFRGKRIGVLDEEQDTYVISSADTPEFAIVKISDLASVEYFELEKKFRHLAIATNSSLGLIAVGGDRNLKCFQYNPHNEKKIIETWSSELPKNSVHELDWVDINGQSRLLIGTFGLGKNAVHILDTEGVEIVNPYLIDGPNIPFSDRHSSIRDVKVSDIDLDGKHEVVFLSNDGKLHTWKL